MTKLSSWAASSNITTVGSDYFGSPIYLGDTIFAVSRKDKAGVVAVEVCQVQGRILLRPVGTSIFIEPDSCVLIQTPYRILSSKQYHRVPQKELREMQYYFSLDILNNELATGDLILTPFDEGLRLDFIVSAGWPSEWMFVSTSHSNDVPARSVYKLTKPNSFDGLPASWLSEIQAANFKNGSDTILYSDMFQEKAV